MGKPKCVELIIKEMERRYKPLARRCDHNALFALGYLRTTEIFLETLDDVDYSDRATVIREDALFAKYYFRAFDAIIWVQTTYRLLGKKPLMQHRAAR